MAEQGATPKRGSGGRGRARRSKRVPVVLGPRTVSGHLQVRAHRSDGFTPEKRDAFLAHLADTCNMSAAARHVGISDTTVRNWRRNDPEFSHRFALVIADAYADLEMRLLAMVREGVTGEQWEEEGADGVKRQRFRRDTPGQLRMLLFHHRHHQHAPSPAEEGERAPRETLNELIDRLRERVAEMEAAEASDRGAGR